MAQGITPNEKLNAREVYGDIIDLPHWEPNAKHRRMTLHDRAAQFAPFAALVGYDEMVDEEARLTDQQIELEEGQMDQLSRKLNRIDGAIVGGQRPTITILYFIPDEKKKGGRYNTISAQVKRIDSANQKMILVTKDQPDLPETISFDRIMDLQGDILKDIDD